MPIVAGGTSFMYNLKIGGKRVTNLRLSGDEHRQDLHRRDHQVERPGHPGRQSRARHAGPADRARGALRRLRHRRPSSHSGCRSSTAASGRMRGLATSSSYPTPAERQGVQNGSLGVAGYVEPGLWRGCDHLRRVLLCAEVGVPGREGAECGGVLHRTDGALGRRRAHEGADQSRPHAEPRRRLQQPGPADVSALELLLPDRPDRRSPASSPPTRARRSARSRTTCCARASNRLPHWATRRCR